MATLIGTIIAALATAAAGVVCLKISKNKQRREAEADVEAAKQKLDQAKADIHKAIFEKDDAAVNAAVARFLACMMLGAIVIGCAAKKVMEVRYVSADRRIISITNENGVACKAVPDVVFAEMCDKLLELEALKKEAAVDKRVGAQ